MSNYLLVLASMLSGYAAFQFSRELVAMAVGNLNVKPQAWDFEEIRLNEIRKRSFWYRHFEPLCRDLENGIWLHTIGNLNSIEKSLQQGADDLPWSAKEYLATKTVKLVFVSAIVGVAISWADWGLALFLAAAILSVGVLLISRRLRNQAKNRIRRFKRRLPFAIDLIALMMEAGGDFRQSLSVVVKENAGNPVGYEFGRIAKAHSAGQPLRECLEQMRERLQDEDINEIVFSVKNAEELGVPLSQIFLTIAEQMRLKQSQLAEKLIGERKTMMVFPAWIIMIACLIVAVAPFILGAMYGGNNLF